MSKITIMAEVVAKKDHIEQVKNELIKLIEPSKNDEGNIDYYLYQNNNKPEIFIFYGNWSSLVLWQKHMINKRISECLKNLDDMIDSFEHEELNLIN